MTKHDTLIGSIRRLGRNGPPYEVVRRAAKSLDGSAQMHIHMIESDEELDYPLVDVLKDPLDD